MTWMDWMLLALIAIALGGWTDARHEASGWKRSFTNLWNQMAEGAIKKQDIER